MSQTLLERLVNDQDPRSLSRRLRNRRFGHLRKLILARAPARILDIGGTPAFWEAREAEIEGDFHVTAVNLDSEESEGSRFTAVRGDATDLAQFRDNEFDIVFSNSTIEHLFTHRDQAAMAREVRRLAPSYCVQTPNYWFPLEPHFLFPGWQWLPPRLRVTLVHRWRIGNRGPYSSRGQAWDGIEEIRLLDRRQLQDLFPDGTLVAEGLGPFVKSWSVLRDG